MSQLAAEDVGKDLGVAMCMGGKAAVLEDAIFVPQRVETDCPNRKEFPNNGWRIDDDCCRVLAVLAHQMWRSSVWAKARPSWSSKQQQEKMSMI